MEFLKTELCSATETAFLCRLTTILFKTLYVNLFCLTAPIKFLLETEAVKPFKAVCLPCLKKTLAGFAGQTGATPLQVRLAGVELTAEGRDWLRRQLEPAETPPTVWLKLIRREGDTLHCLVSKGRVRELALNQLFCFRVKNVHGTTHVETLALES